MTGNIANIQPEINTILTPAEEYFKKCFPREYRKHNKPREDWGILHEEYNNASLIGLDDKINKLFVKVRSQHSHKPDDLTNEDIEAIYNNLGLRDNLGYELLEICSQSILDRIYEKYSLPNAESADGLLLTVMCNRIRETGELVDKIYSDSDELYSLYSNAISQENDPSTQNIFRKLLKLSELLHPISHQFVDRYIDNYSDPRGILSYADAPCHSDNNHWHTDREGNTLQNVLQLAVKYGRTEIVTLLLKRGAHVDIDKYSSILIPQISLPNTLTVAALYGHAPIMDTLCQFGAKFSNSMLKFVRHDAMDLAFGYDEWDICERLILKSLESDRWEKLLYDKCITLDDFHYFTPFRTLHDSVRKFCDHISKSDLSQKDKLMVYTKTIALIRTIINPSLGQYIKKSAISDFHSAIGDLIPRRSPLAKALHLVAIAAAGLVLGAAAAAFLTSLSIPAIFFTGAACASGAAFFAHQYLKNQDTFQTICDAAKSSIVVSSP